ncbi:6-phospho-3-hexuloisomerase [Planococcus sp. ISL-109]|uniref:6-phospho-3-hexuloisomerase n=1 Tax=Planococcus sp. ISL-109 TaxID=2819166 RepID=UPI001BE6F4AC|nr:6-phospho-3-hexuloisomerase [Planococcus sp. ISL-109]MBT2581203.1 6-phospho-3-hexuloisomerase [Planococcus sp. ISL-109]
MNTTSFTNEIIAELTHTLGQVSDEEADKLVAAMQQANKIFVAGGGRSGFMAKAFVMRLMHLGLNAYVVGETVTPSLTADDLFIVGSGSGETGSLLSMTQKAKTIGASVAAITTNPDSSIGKLGDIQVIIPAQAKAEGASGKSIQPMGSLFEQSLLVFYDALILKYMDKQQLTSDDMFGKHANLE